MRTESDPTPTPLSVHFKHIKLDEGARREAEAREVAAGQGVVYRSESPGYHGRPGIGEENFQVLQDRFVEMLSAVRRDFASIEDAQRFLGGQGEDHVEEISEDSILCYMVNGVLLAPDPRDNPGIGGPHFVEASGEAKFNDLTKIASEMASFWSSRGGDMVIFKSEKEVGYQVMALYKDDADGNSNLVAWVAESTEPDNAIYIQKLEEPASTSEQELTTTLQKTKRETRESGAVRVFHEISGETTDADIQNIIKILGMSEENYNQLWASQTKNL
ncbi:hypothetical protein KA025_02625 [Candidatus Saccharibacteria bacterium]|nr:hypothetical protein [Candidatus Saccharibacteria bacterium]